MTERITFASAGAKRKTQPLRTFPEIAAEYAPYHTMRAFQIGAMDYMDRTPAGYWGGRERMEGVDGQAYDRGAEAAMRFTRQHQ